MNCRFEPIAIIGRGCIFPGALDPDSFLEADSQSGGNAISGVDPDRWRIPVESVLGHGPEKSLTDQGGYVTGFVPTELQHLDQLAQWLLYCARQALKEAGIERVPARSGAIAGVLGLPSESLAQYAENVWLGQPNRHRAGEPVHGRAFHPHPGSNAGAGPGRLCARWRLRLFHLRHQARLRRPA